MALRVLVPSARLAQQITQPGVEPIVWHINDDPADAPAAEVLVTERPRENARRARVSRIEGLRHVHLLSIGYEWVLEHLPEKAGLSNSRGAVEDATAELGLALVLAALRELPAAAKQQQQQEWNPRWSTSLHGSTVLVLGHGGVGKEVVSRLLPFRPAQVLRVASRARTLEDGSTVYGTGQLPELLPGADIVILTLPHDATTQGMVDDQFLARMRDGALLVNIGRGPVVDTAALLVELQSQRLRAALDVTDPEPLPSGHPLWSAPGCIITPHIGGNTEQFIELSTELAIEQLRRLAAGQVPLHLVRTAGG